jgi:hypothetical protein
MNLSRQAVLSPRQYLTSVTPPATLEDKSRARHNGVLTSTTMFRLPSGLWVYKGSVGGSGRIDCGTDWIQTSPLSVSIWSYTPSTVGINSRLVENGKFFIYVDNAARQYAGGNAGVANSNTTGTPLVFNTFQHVVVTRATENLWSWYVNGACTSINGFSAPVVGTTNVYLGNRGAFDRGFAGYYQIKIWRKTISASDVYSIYQSERRLYGV